MSWLEALLVMRGAVRHVGVGFVAVVPVRVIVKADGGPRALVPHVSLARVTRVRFG